MFFDGDTRLLPQPAPERLVVEKGTDSFCQSFRLIWRNQKPCMPILHGLRYSTDRCCDDRSSARHGFKHS